MAAKDGPEGLRDVARRQSTRGDLVEQRLEEVIVPPIDERDLQGLVLPELPRGVQPGETAAYDYYPVPNSRLCHVANGARESSFCQARDPARPRSASMRDQHGGQRLSGGPDAFLRASRSAQARAGALPPAWEPAWKPAWEPASGRACGQA